MLALDFESSFNRTSFQQQLKFPPETSSEVASELQSYILSTTTETCRSQESRKDFRLLQSYILSTTTETRRQRSQVRKSCRFNRTSFQQQLKLGQAEFFKHLDQASIVHPFNNN